MRTPAVLVLVGALLVGCGRGGGGDEVAAEGSGPTTFPARPPIDCPEVGAEPPAPLDPRLRAYTDDDLAGLVSQRAAYDLCAVPAEHLFDDARTVALYEEHGTVILPEEDATWRWLVRRSEAGRAVVDAVRGRPGYLKARATPVDGTYTVWATADAIPGFEAEVRARPDAAVRFEEVRHDEAAMEQIEAEVRSRLTPEQDEAVTEVDLEPDRLAIAVDRGSPVADETVEALEGDAGAPARDADVAVDVVVEDRPVMRR
ncbi:MAG TPA: hypothetical protein VK507_00060 [Iamia sp.]|nr:hypothetical protein [Iamia sp.]